MSLYGNKEVAKKYLAEQEASTWQGMKVINNAKAEIESVQIFTTENANYLATSDLSNYMENAEITDVNKAVDGLKEYYNLESITVCYDKCSDEMYKALKESDIPFEGSLDKEL